MSKWLTQKHLLNYLRFIGVLLLPTSLYAVESEKVTTPLESVFPMLTGLVAVLIVIFILAFLFKKFSKFGLSGKNIKVLETQLIGNNEKLMIVQVREQQFLLGVSRNSINQLGELNQHDAELESTDSFNSPAHARAGTSSENEHLKNIPFANILSNLIKPKTIIKTSSEAKMESIK